MDLVQFLRDRLDEDERAALDAGGKAWAWEQHYGDMCNDPTCPYGELATDEAVLMNVHGYDVKEGWSGAAHIARQDPARILVEVESKRRLLAEVFTYEAKIDGEWGCGHDASEIAAGQCPETWPSSIAAVRLLALPFADHADYQQDWKP